MSKNGWFSSAQAPNARPVSDVTNALQAINNKLDMILDALTKPTQVIGPPEPLVAEFIGQMTSSAYDANTMQPVEFKPEEPKRLSGDPAKEQIDEWILEEYKTFQRFATQVGAGRVKARIYPTPPTSKQRKTHTIELKATDTNSEFRPGIFGKTELDEVVAYLESLGINVKNKAPNRV